MGPGGRHGVGGRRVFECTRSAVRVRSRRPIGFSRSRYFVPLRAVLTLDAEDVTRDPLIGEALHGVGLASIGASKRDSCPFGWDLFGTL